MTAAAWGWTVKTLVTVLLALLGVAVETQDFAAVVRPSRRGLFVPFCLVFVIPAVAYALVKALGMDTPSALGVFIFACAPGGAFSNMVAATASAHVPLNAALTCASVIVALAMIPFSCEFVIPHLLTSDNKTPPPLSEVALNMAWIAIPLLSGVALSRHLPRVSRMARRFAGPLGFAFIIMVSVVQGITPPTWRALVAVQILFLIAVTLGLALGLAMRQPKPVVTSILLEMTVHDTPLAQTVFLSTYHARLSTDDAARAMSTILACGLTALFWSGVGVAARITWRYAAQRCCGHGAARGELNDAMLERLDDHSVVPMSTAMIVNQPTCPLIHAVEPVSTTPSCGRC